MHVCYEASVKVDAVAYIFKKNSNGKLYNVLNENGNISHVLHSIEKVITQPIHSFDVTVSTDKRCDEIGFFNRICNAWFSLAIFRYYRINMDIHIFISIDSPVRQMAD